MACVENVRIPERRPLAGFPVAWGFNYERSSGSQAHISRRPASAEINVSRDRAADTVASVSETLAEHDPAGVKVSDAGKANGVPVAQVYDGLALVTGDRIGGAGRQ